MEKRRVVVTGLGTVNPLGNTVAESWAAAKAGQCGIAPITQFDTAGFKCKLAAEVKGFDPEAIVDKKELRKMARFTLLALAAANEAIQDSGLDTEANAKTTGVILSSVVALRGNAGQANYAASKAGLIGLTKSLAKELAGRNITVNAVAPGLIETDMTAALPEAVRTGMLHSIPAGRAGKPEDVANAAAFFAAEQSSYLTGQVLCVDGGMAM